jgi:pyridoxine/pyridoxamine 5'-phosphate oxidase
VSHWGRTLLHGTLVTRAELLEFLRCHRLCVQASVSPAGAPQAAVVGFAASDELEIVFDTIGTTRKGTNLRRNGRIALVVGWDDEQTVQIEGLADEPQDAELDRIKRVYFAAWPDGVERQAWKDITYIRVRPTWARYSDFRPGGRIVELSEADLV